MYSSSFFLLLGPRNKASVYKFNRGTATLQYTEEPLRKEEVKTVRAHTEKRKTTTGRTKEETSGRNEKLQVLVRSSSILILIKDNAEYKGKLVAQEQNKNKKKLNLKGS